MNRDGNLHFGFGITLKNVGFDQEAESRSAQTKMFERKAKMPTKFLNISLTVLISSVLPTG